MKNILLVLLMFMASGAFCQQTKVENDVEYRAVSLEADDRRFLALKDTAQKHMPEFMDNLKKHGADYPNYNFVVKSDFVDGDQHEHMWSQIVGYSNGVFKAIFIDSPFSLKNIKTGDKVSIKKGDVEDWLIYDKKNKPLAGGFSKKYLNSKN